MVQQYTRWTRLTLVCALVLCITFFLVSPARAQGIPYGDTVPAGEVVNGSVLLFGNDVSVEGTVNGDVLAIGNVVTVNGVVQGNLFAAGQTVAVNGQVDGSLYAAAVTLEMGPSSSTGGNLYFAGVSLATQSGSKVGQDLYAATLGAQLSGEIGRTTRAMIGLIEFIKLFTESVDFDQLITPQTEPPPGESTSVLKLTRAQAGGLLALVNPPGVSSVSYTARTGGGLNRAQLPAAELAQAGSGIDTVRLGEWALERLRELTIYLVIGILAVWLIPAPLGRWAERVRTKPLPAAGFGLIAAINGFIIAFLLAVLILMVGLWLGSINLWELTFALWGLGYSSLGLVFSIFLLLFSYGSKIIVAYLSGLLILNRLAPKAAAFKPVPLLLGLILYVLLRSIPVLGWVIGVIVTILGLGAVWLVYRDRYLPTDGTDTQPGQPDIEAAPA